MKNAIEQARFMQIENQAQNMKAAHPNIANDPNFIEAEKKLQDFKTLFEEQERRF